jgi:hypothetical protein
MNISKRRQSDIHGAAHRIEDLKKWAASFLSQNFEEERP